MQSATVSSMGSFYTLYNLVDNFSTVQGTINPRCSTSASEETGCLTSLLAMVRNMYSVAVEIIQPQQMSVLSQKHNVANA
jgi:hypothetical protein